ncbi:unnamed protein product [Owenia fusiformis]|uniref:Uncharacterized protein n=1 Tax=Owenia fusiformis TaxID=6347 RepID=A0A8J1TBR9_OWEFU|nr:unnamed protein product [Owenia fusiformis]
MGSKCLFVSKKFHCGIFEELNEMRKNGEFCDITVVSQEKIEFKVHGVILASASDYFKAQIVEQDEIMASSDTDPVTLSKGKMIELCTVSFDILYVIVDFLYTGCCEVYPYRIKALHDASLLLGITKLTQLCRLSLTKPGLKELNHEMEPGLSTPDPWISKTESHVSSSIDQQEPLDLSSSVNARLKAKILDNAQREYNKSLEQPVIKSEPSSPEVQHHVSSPYQIESPSLDHFAQTYQSSPLLLPSSYGNYPGATVHDDNLSNDATPTTENDFVFPPLQMDPSCHTNSQYRELYTQKSRSVAANPLRKRNQRIKRRKMVALIPPDGQHYVGKSGLAKTVLCGLEYSVDKHSAENQMKMQFVSSSGLEPGPNQEPSSTVSTPELPPTGSPPEEKLELRQIYVPDSVPGVVQFKLKKAKNQGETKLKKIRKKRGPDGQPSWEGMKGMMASFKLSRKKK